MALKLADGNYKGVLYRFESINEDTATSEITIPSLVFGESLIIAYPAGTVTVLKFSSVYTDLTFAISPLFFKVDKFSVHSGTTDGTRTHMVSRTILSRMRLPIPPQRHIEISHS